MICEQLDVCDLLPPHITLGTYSGLPQEELAKWAKTFAATQAPVPVKFSHVGVFGRRVCFAAPRVDEKLLAFHRAFHRQYDDFHSEAGAAYSLAAGSWVPHCSLFLGGWDEMQKALPAALQNFVPIDGCITAVGVAQAMTSALITYPLQTENGCF